MLLQDYVFLDEMAHFDRERIPERVVHAKGAGMNERMHVLVYIIIFFIVFSLPIMFNFLSSILSSFLLSLPFFSLSLPLSSPGAFDSFSSYTGENAFRKQSNKTEYPCSKHSPSSDHR